jgi:hypothetical protein
MISEATSGMELLWFGFECPPGTHVLKTWFPMQQCSEVVLLEGYWIMSALTSSMDLSSWIHNLNPYKEVVETLGYGAKMKKVGHRGCALEGDKETSCPWPPSTLSSLSSLSLSLSLSLYIYLSIYISLCLSLSRS